tara:strand:- start:544 stop:687 length:144 start_codon:yes stop_codon:yes gene_type:complete
MLEKSNLLASFFNVLPSAATAVTLFCFNSIIAADIALRSPSFKSSKT